MNQNAVIIVSLIISIISAIGVIVSIVHTFKTDKNMDVNKELTIKESFVEIKVRIETLTGSFNEMMRKNEKGLDEIKEIREESIKQNERIEALFRYKDDHETRLRKLEGDKNG